MMIRLMTFLTAAMAVLCMTHLAAQPTFPYNGVKDQRDGVYAFTGAKIVVSPDQTLENATLLIRRGRIVAVGTDVVVPAEAVVIDAAGTTITPSFVDLYADYGMPAVERRDRGRGPQMLSDKAGAYGWNEALKPEFSAVDVFTTNQKDAATWRKRGFGAVLSHHMDGISRGSSVLVTVADKPEQEVVLTGPVAHHIAFRKGSSSQDYPGSLMGCIALLRQTWYDAEWYENGGKNKEKNLSLEAWNRLQALPHFFEATDKLEIFRAARIAREFGLERVIYKGSGDEYQRVEDIAALGAPVVLPLNLPKPYDLTDPYDSELLDLADLKHWELAPSNAARLHNAGVPIAFTVSGSEKVKNWMDNLRAVIQAGLPENEALRALTITPASLAGVADQLGTLEPGKWANFLISSGPVFDKGTVIYHNWVQGTPYVLKDLPDESLAGNYRLIAGTDTLTLTVEGTPGSYKMKAMAADSVEVKVSASVDRFSVSLSYAMKEGGDPFLLSGALRTPDRWEGGGTDPSGSWLRWSATALPQDTTPATPPSTAEVPPADTSGSEADGLTPPILYPFSAYGRESVPEATTVLFKNATVWTNEKEGVLKNADVLVRDGKIAEVGRGLAAGDALVVDASGKHLTCGIIDEHSHIAVSRGINEGTQASSAEVRIGDVVDSENINIYRQLAGGVTVAQLLHGSANPIGGQSALIKLRWGMLPEEMLIDNAPGFIKFALGENVKQSNWGDNQTTRYPQTRMGVEQVFEEYFTRAREYGERKASGQPYRMDLELEALLEIVEDQRFITCHSYQQGEINMLMKVAERHGFRVNTFTHILEGYKVADIMAKHGAAGSSFSDWWAYKYEVIDAIPYNGALMHAQGVLTGFNSDDAEMARRLNQEAAKAVKYGGVSEEEAWKFVTLNPAKMLHLDDRMGSIRAGKDADLVLWSGPPLSVYSRAEQTWIDGIRFYDIEEDQRLREENIRERNRLIRAMMKSGKPGQTRTPAGRAEKHYHCDDVHDEG